MVAVNIVSSGISENVGEAEIILDDSILEIDESYDQLRAEKINYGEGKNCWRKVGIIF